MATPPTHESQPVWSQLGISQEDFNKLPPSERIALERTHNPQPPVQRRPLSREALEDVQAQWAGLPPARRITAYRQ
jgi:hypothetical protein